MKTKLRLSVLALVALVTVSLAQENVTYQRPVAAIADLVEAPLTPAISISPDKNWMALLDRSDYPTIEELSRPELRLAGLRINPDNFGPSRNNFFIGVKFKNLKDKKDYTVSGLPANLLISQASFSPDSKKVAVLNTTPSQIELWVVDLATMAAKKITNQKINATLGNAMSWLSDSQTIVFLAVATDGKAMPVKNRVPVGPVIEENLGKRAPNRTYQDLLKNAHDEALFDYFTTAQLMKVSVNGGESKIGAPAIYLSQSSSPDGQSILTRTIQRPYSYLVPANSFPQKVDVIDLNGAVVKNLANIPLADNLPLGFNATIKGPRGHAWRADAPNTIYWVEAQDGGDPKVKADIRDKVMMSAAPYTSAAELASLPLRYGGILWGDANQAWVFENWWTDRKERTYVINPSQPGTKRVLFDRSSEDAYSDPGNPVTKNNAYGRGVMQINKDNSVWLTGQGSSPEGDRPFLDKLDVKTGKTTRVWRSEAPYFEYVVNVLDPVKGVFITSRESLTENPNYFVRTAGSKNITQLTAFPHPYPQIKDVKKQVLKYKRDDGVDLSADLYLPPGYKKEDGPLPTFFWAYPEEFKSKSNAGQVKGSPYTFTRLGWGTPIYWVTRGYAILDNASIPIVGEGDQEPNDTYIQQLVASAKAAVDYGASLGVVDPKRVAAGGHSYGAFMTGNLLAHSDLFAAGIARSGAYNRTLTPFGFQSEERTYWEAPKVYYDMSPFSFADKIKEPILLIHGEADNNTGTFPIQSERFYNALKGHGATTRFVLLPFESHGYRAKESVLHMLWEMDQWLEKYVKNAKPANAPGQ
ncbi:MAG: prolyl oligopeptidase family serine peptidase [Cyclobacteriaceae bacterium]|jgi:dipeptidyl aminopeptidase/acylaminoacyl peptidase